MQNSKMNNKRKEEIFKCDICSVELPSKVCMEEHESGQKHMKLLNAKNERMRVELKCGIFVKGKCLLILIARCPHLAINIVSFVPGCIVVQFEVAKYLYEIRCIKSFLLLNKSIISYIMCLM